jgi:hypothetical protein
LPGSAVAEIAGVCETPLAGRNPLPPRVGHRLAEQLGFLIEVDKTHDGAATIAAGGR